MWIYVQLNSFSTRCHCWYCLWRNVFQRCIKKIQSKQQKRNKMKYICNSYFSTSLQPIIAFSSGKTTEKCMSVYCIISNKSSIFGKKNWNQIVTFELNYACIVRVLTLFSRNNRSLLWLKSHALGTGNTILPFFCVFFMKQIQLEYIFRYIFDILVIR